MTETIAPLHIGIIMDGNRRWAKSKGLSAMDGHKKGLDTLINIVEIAPKKGIKYLSVYAFSTENWQRNSKEVSFLMRLTVKAINQQIKRLNENLVKLVMIGDYSTLSKSVCESFKKAEDLTKNNGGLVLGICFNYGGHKEIIDACNKVVADGKQINVDTISENLYASEIPPIDLVIRTSGERRLSNFMLWRATYSELYFTDIMWPDFNEKELDKAIKYYNLRQRRFGG